MVLPRYRIRESTECNPSLTGESLGYVPDKRHYALALVEARLPIAPHDGTRYRVRGLEFSHACQNHRPDFAIRIQW